MFKVAQDIAMQKQSMGQVSPNDTICVICAASKRVYTGVNHPDMQNGMMINIHAEIDAVQQMRAGGDTIAEYLLLVSTATLQPILPCSGCIGFVLGQAPENANCQVVLPDRMIALPRIGQMTGSNSMPFNGAAPAGGSMYGNSMPYGAAAPAGGSMYGNSMPYGGAAPAGGSMYGNSMPYGNAAPAGGSMYGSSQYGNGGHYMSGAARPKKASGGAKKNKMANLLNAGADIGKDDEPENEFISKLFKKD